MIVTNMLIKAAYGVVFLTTVNTNTAPIWSMSRASDVKVYTRDASDFALGILERCEATQTAPPSQEPTVITNWVPTAKEISGAGVYWRDFDPATGQTNLRNFVYIDWEDTNAYTWTNWNWGSTMIDPFTVTYQHEFTSPGAKRLWGTYDRLKVSGPIAPNWTNGMTWTRRRQATEREDSKRRWCDVYVAERTNWTMLVFHPANGYSRISGDPTAIMGYVYQGTNPYTKVIYLDGQLAEPFRENPRWRQGGAMNTTVQGDSLNAKRLVWYDCPAYPDGGRLYISRTEHVPVRYYSRFDSEIIIGETMDAGIFRAGTRTLLELLDGDSDYSYYKSYYIDHTEQGTGDWTGSTNATIGTLLNTTNIVIHQNEWAYKTNYGGYDRVLWKDEVYLPGSGQVTYGTPDKTAIRNRMAAIDTVRYSIGMVGSGIGTRWTYPGEATNYWSGKGTSTNSWEEAKELALEDLNDDIANGGHRYDGYEPAARSRGRYWETEGPAPDYGTIQHWTAYLDLTEAVMTRSGMTSNIEQEVDFYIWPTSPWGADTDGDNWVYWDPYTTPTGSWTRVETLPSGVYTTATSQVYGWSEWQNDCWCKDPEEGAESGDSKYTGKGFYGGTPGSIHKWDFKYCRGAAD